MQTPYILPFADPEATLDRVGGKGASLAKMAATDLPIPGGFYVTTAAYDDFVTTNNIQPGLQAALAKVDVARPPTIETAARYIRDLFQEAEVPAGVAAAVTGAYGRMRGNQPAVAVRSSATAEDLPHLSFAGQQESYLNVSGTTDLLQAVKDCWASLWTARAIGYRLRNAIDQDEISLAVVVQQLVAGDKAGILFTANPVNGRRDQLLLNAAWGLGESIVGGAVSPDEWVVDKASGRPTKKKIATKQVMTVLNGLGTKETAVDPARQQQPTLNSSEIAQLAVLARRVEAHFGRPQDIEWVAQNGEFHVVQSRPITSLFPLPEPLPRPEDGLRVYVCLNLVFQGITEPLTPFGLEIFRLLYVGMLTAARGKTTTKYPDWAKAAAGRMYLDMTGLLRKPERWSATAENIGRKDPVAGKALLQVLEEHGDKISGRPGVKLPWRLVLKILPALTGRALRGYVQPELSRNRMIALSNEYLAHLEQAAQTELHGVADRLLFLEKEATAVFWQAIYEVSYCSAGIRGPDFLPALLEKWAGDAAQLHPVLQSLPDNPTTEMGLTLLQIARQLQLAGEEPTATHPAVRAFLEQFGHRSVQEIDAGMPRWHDDPEYVLEVIGSYMQGDPAAKIAELETAAEQAEAAIEEIVARVRRRKSGVHARLIGHLLRVTRTLAGLRERPKFDMIRAFALFRRVMVDVGQELVAQGRLDNAEDALFVTFAEIEAGGRLQASAAQNRAEYERELERLAVPRVMTSSGETVYGAAVEVGDNGLAGTAVSAGVYEGIARVVHRPQGADLVAGEILVTHSTDPGWTPLFLNAGALVMETGGPISHGAIVAREYGIPAVAGVAAATQRVRSGDRIRVDGEQGIVQLL